MRDKLNCVFFGMLGGALYFFLVIIGAEAVKWFQS